METFYDKQKFLTCKIALRIGSGSTLVQVVVSVKMVLCILYQELFVIYMWEWDWKWWPPPPPSFEESSMLVPFFQWRLVPVGILGCALPKNKKDQIYTTINENSIYDSAIYLLYFSKMSSILKWSLSILCSGPFWLNNSCSLTHHNIPRTLCVRSWGKFHSAR